MRSAGAFVEDRCGTAGWPLCRTIFLCGVLLLLAQPSRGEFSVKLLADSVQMRNFIQAGHRDSHWLRVLPPLQSFPGDPQTLFMVVWVPDSWASGEKIPSAADVARENAQPLAALDGVLWTHGLLTDGDALLKAARVISMVRPVSAGDSCKQVAPRYAEIWPLWRVLLEADCADTLSAAFSALQVLDRNRIEARLARYPDASGTAVFGVLLPQATPALGAPWAYRLGTAELLPVHPSLVPGAVLEPKDIVSWSWTEVLAPNWSPAVTAVRAPTHGIGRRPAPDLCRQRQTLGLDCKKPERWRGATLKALSAAILLMLLFLVVGLFQQRRHRLTRVTTSRDAARRRTF